MTITVYKSTDASAPSLSGTVGSLVALLDAVLVNGYGSKPAAGWTKAYSGTNKAAYKNGSGSTGLYLRVDDTGTGAANYARVVGYETMSDVDTGVNPFPSAVQFSGGYYCAKSTSTDATARPWTIIACERAFYLIAPVNSTVWGASSSGNDAGLFFGDLKTYKSGDAYHCAIASNTATTPGTGNALGAVQSSSSWASTLGHAVCRSYTQAGTSVLVAKAVPRLSIQATSLILGTDGTRAYPNPVTGALDLSPILAVETGNVPRGQYPGFYEPQHNLPASIYDTFSGASGDLAGLTFMLVPVCNTTSNGRAAIQTNGTWY